MIKGGGLEMSTESSFKNRRKNYFIDKNFQKKFIVKFCILVIIGAFLSGFIIYSMSKSAVTTTFENSRLKIKSTADFILPAVLLSGAIAVMIIGAATVVVTLFTSHRIAGPLYRVEKDIKEVASGNLNVKIHLRQSDELKALASALGNMVQSLKKNVSEAKSIVSELEKTLESSGETPEAVKGKLRSLKSALSKFKT